MCTMGLDAFRLYACQIAWSVPLPVVISQANISDRGNEVSCGLVPCCLFMPRSMLLHAYFLCSYLSDKLTNMQSTLEPAPPCHTPTHPPTQPPPRDSGGSYQSVPTAHCPFVQHMLQSYVTWGAVHRAICTAKRALRP